ncbi:MAG: hypothetical protein IKS92_12035, partial [Victivallales bacterium]|nr:hypothetical protein [Victivallales bacterium]
EYTEGTESHADVGHGSEEFVENMLFCIKEESVGPPSARRFVTLRASGNNVMRKLEVFGLSVSAGSVCSAVSMRIAQMTLILWNLNDKP